MRTIEEQISYNKKKTIFFLFLFMLLFVGVGFLIGIGFESILFGVITMMVIFVVVFFFSYYTGHNVIARLTGARPVTKEEEPYLYHILEAVALGAGIPVPKGYVIETDVPNAFAAGRNPEKSIVGVTRGLLDRLDRAETEAVIAHEISHIKNYDILVATIATVLSGVILLVSKSLRYSVYFGGAGSRRRSSGRGGGGGLMLLILLLVSIIAPLFAKALKYAISREREYLADVSAADLTNHPESLASALEKISGLQTEEDDKLSNEGVSGLFIVNPMMKMSGDSKLKFFSTHPSVEERIKILRNI